MRQHREQWHVDFNTPGPSVEKMTQCTKASNKQNSLQVGGCRSILSPWVLLPSGFSTRFWSLEPSAGSAALGLSPLKGLLLQSSQKHSSAGR